MKLFKPKTIIAPVAILCLLLLMLQACATVTPALYPNRKYNEAKKSGQLQVDIDECKNITTQAVDEQKGKAGKSMAKNAAIAGVTGAAIGAGVGAAVWAVFDLNPADGAAFGAALFGAKSAMGGAADTAKARARTENNMMHKCLKSKGYFPVR